MITKDGANVRVWQDAINGPITLHVEETERGSDGESVEVILTKEERAQLRSMLQDFEIDGSFS